MPETKIPSQETLSALETAPSMYLILSPDLHILTASDLYLQATKTTREAIKGRHIFEAFPENPEQPDADGVQNINASLQAVLHTKKPDQMRIQRYDVPDPENPGKFIRRYWDPCHSPVLDQYGNILYIIQLATNVTERFLSERALHQSHLENLEKLEAGESRLRMAVESTGLGTWDYFPGTGELKWSRECRNIFGLDNDKKITFDTYIRHICADDREWVSSKIKSSLQPGNNNRYELSHRIVRSNDKQVRWVKAQGTVEFKAGVASRFLGTVLDITELKQVEEKSARLAAIVDSTDDAIVSKTLESVITTWNDSAERMFGYTASEMIGETIYKLIPPDRHEEEPMILSRLKAGDRVEHFETKRQTRDGRLIDVSLTISPIKDSRGNIIGLSKIARDISERKQDDVRKNDFIAMVSHEIKTPLTSMSAIVQVLQKKFADSQDVIVPKLLDRANIQVKKMSVMINSFLNVSRLETGKIQIIKQTFNLCELIREVIGELNLAGLTHNIDLRECKEVAVQADREKIDSVLSNLLSNAIKYSPQGSNIVVDCYQQGSNVCLSVKDQGSGISSEDCAHIFDRYYRVETDSSSQPSGFGIGLYLSAEIIHHHKGSIWVESEIGKGSTFYFSFPLQEG